MMYGSNRISVAAFVALAGACGSPGPVPTHRYYAGDSESFSGTLAVYGESGVPPVDSEWALVLWPELTPVSATVFTPLSTSPGFWIMEIMPSEPMGPRWYAVRWTGVPREGVTIVGIPLADGSVVNRVFGEPRPAVHQLIGHDADGALTIRFNMNVDPAPSANLQSMITVAQGDAECALDFRGGHEAIRADAYVVCVPALDWSAPISVHVEGAVCSDAAGPPSEAWDVEVLFPAAFDGIRVITVPSMLIAPPVPTALCDGVACEA